MESTICVNINVDSVASALENPGWDSRPSTGNLSPPPPSPHDECPLMSCIQYPVAKIPSPSIHPSFCNPDRGDELCIYLSRYFPKRTDREDLASEGVRGLFDVAARLIGYWITNLVVQCGARRCYVMWKLWSRVGGEWLCDLRDFWWDVRWFEKSGKLQLKSSR